MRFSLLILGILICSPVHAEIVYDLFIRTSLGDSGNFAVAPSQILNGEVILRETTSTPSSSPLDAANLSFFRVDVSSSGSDGFFQNLTTDATLAQGNQTGDSDTLGFVSFGPTQGQSGKAPVSVGPGVNEIVLGNLDLVAPSAIGDTTDFFLGVGSPAGPGNFIGNFDGSLVSAAVGSGGSVNFLPTSITAVPEPSSVALMGLAGCGVAARFRKRLYGLKEKFLGTAA